MVGLLVGLLVGDEFGSGSVDGVGVLGFGKGHVQFGQGLHGLFDLGCAFGYEAGEVGQDAVHLLRLCQFEFAPGIVQFDDGQRLNKNSRARGGHVVDNAPDAALEISLEGETKAALALRDERLLQKGSVSGRMDDPPEFILYPAVGDTHLTADAGQLGRGVVAHVPAFIQATVYLDYDCGAGLDAAGETRQVGELVLQPGQGAVEVASGDEGVAHVKQFCRRQHGPALGGRHQRANVVGAAQSGAGLVIQQRASLARHLQPLANLLKVGRGRERARQFRPGGKTGVGRQAG